MLFAVVLFTLFAGIFILVLRASTHSSSTTLTNGTVKITTTTPRKAATSSSTQTITPASARKPSATRSSRTS